MVVRSLKVAVQCHSGFWWSGPRFLVICRSDLRTEGCEYWAVRWGGKEFLLEVHRVLWLPFHSSPLDTWRMGEGKTLFLASKVLFDLCQWEQ